MLAALTSCETVKNTVPLDLPTHAINVAEQSAEKDPLFASTKDWVAKDWWKVFEDEQLSDFIQRAFIRNPTLQITRANILLAAYNADKARAARFPHLNWAGDVSRQKLSETGLIPFSAQPLPQGQAPLAIPPGTNLIPVYFTQTETEFILNYDFDIWNKNRNTWLSALDEVQSKIADEAFSRLQLSISVAKVYFQLQINYKRREVLQELFNNRNKYVQFIKNRLAQNIDTNIAKNNAEINLTHVRGQLYQVEADIIIEEYQLKTYLAGTFDEDIFNTHVAEKPLPKVPLPKEIPLHLIAHRPDIIAQIWLIESAGWQIEVARAGFYPDFNIAAIFGFQTIHLQELFKWPSSYYNIDPAFTLPIFDGGRLISNLHNSEVNFDLAILKYNDLILNATRDVLEGIATLRITNQQLQELKKQTGHLEDSNRLTDLRVKHHVSSGLDYLVSEADVLNARDQELQYLGKTYEAILSLIKALGGGYDACYEEGIL